MPRGRKKAEVAAPKKKATKKKAKDLSMRCEDCAVKFERSKFSSNQKYCPACSRLRRLAAIKAKTKFKRKAASMARFSAWAKSKKVAEEVGKLLKNKTPNEKFRYLKKQYPAYITYLKKNLA